MRLCAVSDLHGRLPKIPDCELLIIAGDICPDISFRKSGHDPDLSRLQQREWLRGDFADWADTLPAERIIATPGNHDWTSTFPENVRAEMFVDELVEWRGKKFWLTPWVSPCGCWNYQLPIDQRKIRYADIPRGLDVLVSHAPAYQLGDLAYGDVRSGCKELRDVIDRTQPRFVIYGHIHEAQRYGRENILGPTVLFNVAMWGESWQPLVIEI